MSHHHKNKHFSPFQDQPHTPRGVAFEKPKDLYYRLEYPIEGKYTQIYRLQYKLLVVEDGIKEMIDVSNFQVYTSYHVSIAQTILSRLQTGTVSIENNIDKIFEFLRIMSSHKATSAVMPPVALRKLLVKIENRMRTNPRLKLPYDPRAGGIWKYYSVIKITLIVMDKMLVILMTIPVLDKSLELNIYQVHNLPAIPPDKK